MKCIHHDDIDGRSAGNVVAVFEDNFNPEDFIEMNYVKDFPLEKIEKDEKLYIVDYSFSVNTEGVLDKILEKTKNVIWIDHHQSSVELVQKRPDFGYIKGFVKEGISGAALAAMYLWGKTYDELPMYLKYVSDYDCFHLKLPRVMNFKYGIEGSDYGVLSDLWTSLYEEWCFGKEADIYGTLAGILDYGMMAEKYSKSELNDYLEKNGYEIKLEGHPCMVVNRKSSSAIFGDKFKEYPLCMTWVYEGKTQRFIYTVYSHDDTVDCSKIAQKFGGGGHPGAAGFSSAKQIF